MPEDPTVPAPPEEPVLPTPPEPTPDENEPEEFPLAPRLKEFDSFSSIALLQKYTGGRTPLLQTAVHRDRLPDLRAEAPTGIMWGMREGGSFNWNSSAFHSLGAIDMGWFTDAESYSDYFRDVFSCYERQYPAYNYVWAPFCSSHRIGVQNARSPYALTELKEVDFPSLMPPRWCFETPETVAKYKAWLAARNAFEQKLEWSALAPTGSWTGAHGIHTRMDFLGHTRWDNERERTVYEGYGPDDEIDWEIAVPNPDKPFNLRYPIEVWAIFGGVQERTKLKTGKWEGFPDRSSNHASVEELSRIRKYPFGDFLSLRPQSGSKAVYSLHQQARWVSWTQQRTPGEAPDWTPSDWAGSGGEIDAWVFDDVATYDGSPGSTWISDIVPAVPVGGAPGVLTQVGEYNPGDDKIVVKIKFPGIDVPPLPSEHTLHYEVHTDSWMLLLFHYSYEKHFLPGCPIAPTTS